MLEVLSLLVNDPVRFADVSVPYLFRRIEKAGDTPPTLMLDEADAIFSAGRPSERSEALRGILNTGFQRGFVYGRVEKPNNQLKEYRVFALAAIASIGALPDTIEDRAIVLTMRRRSGTELVEQFRLRDAGEYLAVVRHRLHRLLTDHQDEIAGVRPELPVEDRAADLWEPLVAVAHLAGDEWINRAWTAAITMVEQAREDESSANVGLALLEATREVLNSYRDGAWIGSVQLVEALSKVPEYRDLASALGVAGVARVLRLYGVRPANHRVGESVRKGYRLVDLRDAWMRYLPSALSPATGATPLLPQRDQEEAATRQATHPLRTATHEANRGQGNAEHPAAASVSHIEEVTHVRS
ncbi:DUF3631 domain-containing protein [Microbacterium foliorum]|uniref:DUF3631 domain-containing protein n=1 Tax=Microbacterium foliorum TaxID=104336 RepID=A0A4Y5YLV7_9MICO|nr:DUF3631 domain-containing protein [Microbacterium foliorum]